MGIKAAGVPTEEKLVNGYVSILKYLPDFFKDNNEKGKQKKCFRYLRL